MRKLFQLAALAVVAATASARAQIVSTDKMVAPTPRNPAVRLQKPAAEYQWLWQYARSNDKPDMLADARFDALLKENLKAPQAMWGIGTPLHEVAKTFLGGDGLIASNDNRHLTVTGCVVDHCPQRGLLWIDLGEPNPLIAFSALRWNEQGNTPDEKAATFTLWLFPNRALDAHQLPEQLKSSLSSWRGVDACPINRISSVIVVDPTGVPHVISKSDAGLFPAYCDKRPLFQKDKE